MTKDQTIKLKRMHDALVKLIWSDAPEENGNSNAYIVQEIPKLGYNVKHLMSSKDAIGLAPGFIVISNESDDMGWMYVETEDQVLSFIEHYDEWDLENGEGVVVVYFPL